MSKCVKCHKDTDSRYKNCPKCNPNRLLITCKCKGCQCEGGHTIDGDWIPRGYGYNVQGDLVPIGRNILIPSTT